MDFDDLPDGVAGIAVAILIFLGTGFFFFSWSSGPEVDNFEYTVDTMPETKKEAPRKPGPKEPNGYDFEAIFNDLDYEILNTRCIEFLKLVEVDDDYDYREKYVSEGIMPNHKAKYPKLYSNESSFNAAFLEYENLNELIRYYI